MGVHYRKLLDSSVALKKGRAHWLQIRAGLFAQHLFFVFFLLCFFGMTLKRARRRDPFVATQLQSMVTGTA